MDALESIKDQINFLLDSSATKEHCLFVLQEVEDYVSVRIESLSSEIAREQDE